jgi:signal transduction histidine kinase
MNRLFEERLDERTRIAQELHDTLIQDLTAVSLSAELIDDQLPSEPIPAKETLAGLRREVARIMANGRAAMATLRFVTVSNERLVDALSRAVSEVRGGDDPQPRVEFIVEGTEYPLRYDLRDELYRIGREALSNAMRHSSAHHVVVELLYEPTGIRLRVADDGQGMDEAVIANGRPGHFGLRGMHERARRLNAKFDVVSRRGAGTEVSITVSTEASAVEGAGV